MKEIHSEIEIDASAERVWQILTDFDSFPEWNPFIRRISGEITEGATLEAFLQPPGGKGMTFRPKVLKAEHNQELRWLGKLWISGLFNGEHIFVVESLGDNRVRFLQHEKFTGVLVPLFGNVLANTKRGFDEMNQSLKERAEQTPLK